MSCEIAYDGVDQISQIQAYENLLLYLDPPFVLRILGLNWKAMQDTDIAMVDQLRQTNATFKIFRHTYYEIDGIINDCILRIDNPNYEESRTSMALRSFVNKNFTKDQIQAYKNTLLLRLEYYGIEIDDTNFYASKYYQHQTDKQWIHDSIIGEYQK